MHSTFCEKICEISPNIGDTFYALLCRSHTSSDLARYPMVRINPLKSIFVSRIVSDIDRQAPNKRRHLHKSRYRLPFIHTLWLNFAHAITINHAEPSENFNMRCNKLIDVFFHFRVLAKMQRDGMSLILE